MTLHPPNSPLLDRLIHAARNAETQPDGLLTLNFREARQIMSWLTRDERKSA